MFAGRKPAGFAVSLTLLTVWAGCAAPPTVADPLATLGTTQTSPRNHIAAMEMLDAQPENEEYQKALHDMIWRPGFITSSREAAFTRLVRSDLDGLKRTIRQRLPRMQARAWAERLCELIVENGWRDLSPALISAWANRIGFVDDTDRVEYHALVSLHGEQNVVDVVFDLFVESNKVYQQGLRTRCWELLHRLGYRERLIELLADTTVGQDDPMLIDLRAGAVELDLVPRNREEILWMRKLREPQRAEFWSQAVQAVAGLPEARRRELELRTLPIVVAASIHDPWLLDASVEELYQRVRDHIRASRLHINTRRFEGFPGTYGQQLGAHRAELTWGDLAAMLLAIRAMRTGPIVEHLFDYADRDHDDESCEYGGVIGLDEQGRFELLEFPPRYRTADNRFDASQAMMDAGYTAVFHFHNHAQEYRNTRYAGPGIGDLNYADNTRPNCLVFTFVTKDTLNVDFYRHSRVIVDLGEIKRR